MGSIRNFAQKAKIYWIKAHFASIIFLFFIIFFSCQKDEFPGRATIGSQGGSLISLDGKIKINIPANSISGSTVIRVTEGYDELFSLLNGTTKGKVYNLEPVGLTFSKPINVEINYTDLSEISNPENLGVAHLGSVEDKFISNISVNNNLVNKTLAFPIDHFSQLKIVEFQSKCATFKFYWNVPVIKWFLEIPLTTSYLTEANIQSALSLWANETGNLTFERTYDKNTANIIFTEVGNNNGFKEFESKLHIHNSDRGMVSLDFSASDIGDVALTASNHINIYIASKAFNSSNEAGNLNNARKVIAHEIGHALGIAHAVQLTSPNPVMSESANTSELWDGKLHEWDINALHEKYPLKQSASDISKIDTLVNNLEYPVALFLSNKKLYYTENAGWNITSGGKETLNSFNTETNQKTLLMNYPDGRDAMVVVGDRVYLSSWVLKIPGEEGNVTVFDLIQNKEIPFMAIEIATKDMCLDSYNNFYLLGSSDLSTAKSLYKFPAPYYTNKKVLLTGLGRTWSIASEDDNIYYSDQNCIWKVESTLSKTIFYQKTFISGIALSDNYMYISEYFNNKISRINMQSKVVEVLFSNISYPGKMVYDKDNKVLYVLSFGTDIKKYKDGKILKITNAY